MTLISPYQSPLLYLVRHGTTDANEQGLFRGVANYPLNDDGTRAAEEAAYYLSFRTIGFIACSPMLRAVQTAQIIAGALQLSSDHSFDRNPGLLPWNIGTFSGKSRAKYSGDLQRYIDNPDLVPPDGESLTAFRQRSADVLYRYLAQASFQMPGVLILHTSNITATHQVLDENWDEIAPETADIVEPGGIVAVYSSADGQQMVMEPVLGAVVKEGNPTAT